MELQIASPSLYVGAGEIVSLDDAVGTCIKARLGHLWITEENVNQDFFVEPGEVFVVSHPGRTIVQAIEPAWITIGGCQ
jgi:Protein of unknown function (DUF2917)